MNLINKETLGKEIKQKRKAMHLTQSDLSEKTGISRTYIADIEKGRYYPSIKTLSKIAEVIKIDVNHIISSNEGEVN